MKELELKEKARELICCDEIINAIDDVNKASDYRNESHEYWLKVKEEIEKL